MHFVMTTPTVFSELHSIDSPDRNIDIFLDCFYKKSIDAKEYL